MSERGGAQPIHAVVQSGRLQLCDAVPQLIEGLDAGECAAIARALEIGAGLLSVVRPCIDQLRAGGQRLSHAAVAEALAAAGE